LLVREQVTVLNQTPSAFRQLLPHLEGSIPALRLVIFGGEALDPRTLGGWPGNEGRPLLVNMYGITETTVHVTWHELGATVLSTSPIGRPLPHLSIVLLDRLGNPVPMGVPGEIHVGGDGLMRGYLGRPALTAERLVPSPLGRGERFYRSGDLARWLLSGELEFLGRIDHQVKVRGFRIEPGEIEAALAACPGVAEAVVVLRDDLPGGPGLAAFVLPRPGEAPAPAALRDALRARLPEPLVPVRFTVLDRLPLTPSGKVDRNALARGGETPGWNPRSVPVPPRTPVEEVLAGIFRQLLGAPGLGVHDDFFEAGGHSLTAVEALAAIRRTFDVEVELRSLFERPTVAGLAAVLGERPEERDKVEKIAALTVELAGLSEEEIEAMLLAENADELELR
jgi:acyl carrier protein